jgi:hypothetical protein
MLPSGYTKPIDSDPTLEATISSLISPINVLSEPRSIPTYLGRDLIPEISSMEASTSSKFEKPDTGKEQTWSRGLGLELSPLKTRSAREKNGSTFSSSVSLSTDQDQGALRGMKSLARVKS